MKNTSEFFQFQLVIDAGNVFIGTPPRKKKSNCTDKTLDKGVETELVTVESRAEPRRIRCNITVLSPTNSPSSSMPSSMQVPTPVSSLESWSWSVLLIDIWCALVLKIKTE